MKKIEKQKTEPKPYVIPETISVVEDLDFSGTYSYANYLRWEFEERLELIKGKIFKMAAPTTLHQRVTGRIHGELYHFLKKHSCEVLVSPFDVRFPEKSAADDAVFTVLQPDVCVVCDAEKLDNRGCIGAPDLIVEVLSPSSRKKDMVNKFNVYEKHKVKEYWIVEPTEKCILKYRLNTSGLFIGDRPYQINDQLTSCILPGFCLTIDEVFN
ncbi:MAG: Uma2 family endonuclease [Bacteroidota bacterium]